MNFPQTIWLSIIVVSIFFLGCAKPGEGERAEKGFRQGEKIVKALTAYRQISGHYPDSLESLVPSLLDKSDIVLVAAPNSIYPFSYHKRNGEEFELSFRYSWPGINDCTYESKSLGWKCFGRY